MKNISYDEIIRRMSYFRAMANLSAREASQRLGYNPSFMKTIENKTVELKVKTLLDFCDMVGISVYDFFYIGDNYNIKNKEILDLILSLSDEQRKIILDLIKTMKK